MHCSIGQFRAALRSVRGRAQRGKGREHPWTEFQAVIDSERSAP